MKKILFLCLFFTLFLSQAFSQFSFSVSVGSSAFQDSIFTRSSGVITAVNSTDNFRLGSTSSFSWSTDVFLFRDAASVLAQRNGETSQTFRIYNTFTDASNYQRISIFYSSNEAFLRAESAGTGVAHALHVRTQGMANVFFGTNNTDRVFVSVTGLFAQTDNVYDIGASGANRFRNIFISGGFTHGSATLLTTTTSLTNGAAAQTGTLSNSPSAGNPTKWIPVNDNGTTRYIPAW